MQSLEEQLENMEKVQYRMDGEGFHYCFKNYSSFKEVEDPEFHQLRLAYLDAANKLEDYVNKKVDSLKDQIEYE